MDSPTNISDEFIILVILSLIMTYHFFFIYSFPTIISSVGFSCKQTSWSDLRHLVHSILIHLPSRISFCFGCQRNQQWLQWNVSSEPSWWRLPQKKGPHPPLQYCRSSWLLLCSQWSWNIENIYDTHWSYDLVW